MMEILNKKLLFPKDLAHKKAAILVFLADWIGVYYIHSYWLSEKIDKLLSFSLGMQGLSKTSIPADTYNQLKFVSISSLSNFLIFVMLWHSILYFILFFKRKAINYIYRYVLVTLLISILEIFSLISDFSIWSPVVILINLLYLLSFLILKKIRVQ